VTSLAKRLQFAAATLLLFFAFFDDAFAWGDEGHKIVCEIAMRRVSTDTRTEITRLLAADQEFSSFVDACTWADHPRKRAAEHFLNLPRNATGLAGDDCGEASTCVVSAIRQDAQILAAKGSSDSEKLAALKYLGHWVGDVHQPLHVSFRDDRGGNDIRVSGVCGPNLHAVWDIRLHDRSEMPICDEVSAIAACQPLAEIYLAWKQGNTDCGPHLIDELGRPVPNRPRAAYSATGALPGTIAAIAADFLASDEYADLKPSTQDDYRLCLEMLVKKFGPRRWETISAKEAKAWIREKAGSHPSMAHQWYRTCRAVLNKTRLIYDERDHPGYVSQLLNPFDKLNVGLPKARLIVWPHEAITAMVALADERGRPSLGDAMVTMMWLGARRQDWLAWPATIFDTPYLAWDTEKTDAPVTIPWSVVPELRERIEAAKLRRQRATVRGTTFFVDDVGQRPWSANRFHSAFDGLRAELAKRHESFATRYAVKHYPADPMRVPTAWLTMRVLRHTCITALHDAGCVREQIRAITGHTIASINEVLDRYTKLTADQAGAALERRLAHEGAVVGGSVTTLVRR